jgi:hypothetical protein
MRNLQKIGTAAALCLGMGLSLSPDVSNAGVMSIADKSSVSLASPTDQVHWRRFCHRHWGYYGYYPRRHYGYYGGWCRPRCHYGYYGYYPRTYGYYGYYPSWRYAYYPRYRYGYYGGYPYGYGAYGYYNPVGSILGAAAGLATAATAPAWGSYGWAW